MTLEVMYKPFRTFVHSVRRLFGQSQSERDQERTDQVSDDVAVGETTVSIPVPPALRDSDDPKSGSTFEQTVRVRIEVPSEVAEYIQSESRSLDRPLTVERIEDFLADIIILERSYYIDGEPVEK